jgi:hypothetical protein
MLPGDGLGDRASISCPDTPTVINTPMPINKLLNFLLKLILSKRTDQLLISRSIPQRGHVDGVSLTISGCIGHVYSFIPTFVFVESGEVTASLFSLLLHDKINIIERKKNSCFISVIIFGYPGKVKEIHSLINTNQLR